MQYTPLQTNQAPTLGTSGPAVGALQAQYNAANPTAVPLKVDNLYGPLTQAALNPPKNQLVVSGAQAANQFNKMSSDVDALLAQYNPIQTKPVKSTVDNTNDGYTQMLDRMSSTSDLATKALIGTIQAQRAQRGASVDAQYENYKRGLQTLGIQHNEAQATPDLLLGHIQQAENEHQAKLQQYDVEMNKALIDANTAKQEKDFGLLRERMNYIKELNTEKNNYLKQVADDMKYQTEIAETQAGQFYDAMQKLSPTDQEAFLVAASQKFNLPLGALVKAVATEKERRDEKLAKKKATGGTGTGTSGGYTAQELRKLRAQGINPKNITAADAFLYKGEVPGGEDAGTIYDEKYIRDTFDKGQLFKMREKFNIPRVKDLSRKGEIDQVVAEIQKRIDIYKANGISDADIEAYLSGLTEE